MSDDKTNAPAVHSDELWGGPRFIENAGHEPVWVETKEEYWDLLNRRGLRMKDQQESSTGPERETLEPRRPELQPMPLVHALSYDDAQVFNAANRVNQQLGLLETLDCDICFALGRHPGVRSICKPALVRIECRCGSREYIGPVGTDAALVFNQARTLAERTSGHLFGPNGETVQTPAVLMTREEAQALRQYATFLRARRLSTKYFCRGCWSGRVTEEGLMVKISPHQIVLPCRCRIRYWQG